MKLVATTAERVIANTADEVNARIRQRTDDRVAELRGAGPEAIEARLRALDREWDIERCLETGASSLVLIGTVLAAVRGARWLLLPAGVAGFLLQHAIQGWCPPLPLFRRLGVRTADEINDERQRLKALLHEPAPYGDPSALPPDRAALAADMLSDSRRG
jgi:hypothetical protein